MAKRGQAINRYEVQIVFPSGAWMRQSSTRNRELTALEIIDSIEGFCRKVRPIVEGKPKPAEAEK